MKQDRVLELFFRGLRGEDISVKNLAEEYKVSTKNLDEFFITKFDVILVFLIRYSMRILLYYCNNREKQ